MFDAIPQELKESVEKALREASRGAYDLLAEAEKLVDKVSEQLDEWADELGGTDNKNKYHYIYSHGNEFEKKMFEQNRRYLMDNPDVLDSIYESKRVESETPLQDGFADFFKNIWEGKT